ncbi:receptor-like protein EIX1 [Neltuma alba]|uniref:receptor-like protein EIX1 n=1 Tax=Neltuma alba TaxID=207710 RepID=UPI0010A46806|nr:receptor-like protein EIX1 [Prosopis alba]
MLHNKGTYSLRVQCDERDRHLLLNFKQTVGDPSSILSGWSDGRDCCEWIGIQCDNTTGRVIELSLPCSLEAYDYDCEEKKSHCLTGEFHLSLLRLEFLNYLDLSNNDFHVITQHDSSKNSSNLHHLDLSYNEDLFIDSLHWISRFASLKYVNFSGINLQGKLDWLQLPALLPSLTELHLDRCHLENISPSLQYVNFTSLEVLSLSDNAFNSEIFPNWLFNLSDVTSVNLSYNYFHGQLPNRLLNLGKLKSLDLQGNQLSGPIPAWLGQLKHLQVLDISHNLLYGHIPPQLGNLSSLVILNLNSNNLNGSLPESLGQLLNLEMFNFYDNHLMGYVSERNFVKLSNLKALGMGSPGLIFDFDLSWVPPFQLEGINLVHIVGSKFPEWIYTQKSLRVLVIISSSISFQSQDNFWNLATQLRCICLQENTIDWDISDVLLNSTYVSLSSNKFKGNLPRLSPNVVTFNARNNSFQGSISSLLCQKMSGRSNLKYLDMSNNLLSGGLTNCWMHWKSLVIIRLGGNNLTGTVLPSISFLSNLKILHLNNNNFFGEIPMSLKNCQNLQILDVAENKFSGFIPNWIGHNVKIIQFRSNQFSGTIPSEVCQLESLIILDFANNKLSGSIPKCLHNMTAMRQAASSNVVNNFCGRILCSNSIYGDNVELHIKGLELIYEENVKLLRAIDLSSNYMSGTIPPEMFSLSELHSLNLSHNQLEGNILREIGNLKQLESLDLAHNQFSGEIPQSLAQLSFLGTLNLSFNNFSGMIPSGTQLQGFNVLSYIGNLGLCGAPLPKNCTHKDVKPTEGNYSEEDEFLSSFYIGIGVGFAVAFWGVCAVIFFNNNFRHSYFRFLYHIRDKFYVMVILRINRFH